MAGSAKQDREQIPVVRIPLAGGEQFEISPELFEELDEIYGAVDPLQTLREIRGWCLGNPARCKTQRGVKRFIVSWFAREQEKHGGKK